MSEWTKRYEYKKSSVETHTPSKGGVYRLIYHSGDKYYVFYVGKSNNLQRRLLEHLSYSEENACIKRYLKDFICYFRHLEVSNNKEQDEIEQQQISEYNPRCND